MEFDSYTRDLMWEPGRTVTLVHNHPRISGLSSADLGTTIAPGMDWIEAIGRDGPSEVISAGRMAGVPLIDKYDGHTLNERFKDVFAVMNEEVRKHIQPVVNTQKFQLNDASVIDSYAKLEVLEKAGVIEHKLTDNDNYVRDLQGRFNKAAKDAKAYKKLVKASLKRLKEHNSYLVFNKFREGLHAEYVGKQEQQPAS